MSGVAVASWSREKQPGMPRALPEGCAQAVGPGIYGKLGNSAPGSYHSLPTGLALAPAAAVVTPLQGPVPGKRQRGDRAGPGGGGSRDQGGRDGLGSSGRSTDGCGLSQAGENQAGKSSPEMLSWGNHQDFHLGWENSIWNGKIPSGTGVGGLEEGLRQGRG